MNVNTPVKIIFTPYLLFQKRDLSGISQEKSAWMHILRSKSDLEHRLHEMCKMFSNKFSSMNNLTNKSILSGCSWSNSLNLIYFKINLSFSQCPVSFKPISTKFWNISILCFCKMFASTIKMLGFFQFVFNCY